MDAPDSPHTRKGRGAVSNASGRFETHTRHTTDDGWGSVDADPPRLTTVVVEEKATTIIARNTSPDIGFDRSINPYRGCEHGCIYCYARPTHAYLGLSPGLDFESRLFAKANAAEALERELQKPGYRPQPIMLGANTDPYQPLERKRRITRAVLEVLSAFNHPVTIATKSALVVRDIDILAPMAERRLVAVGISLTTLDGALARRMEPRAASPQRRLQAIRTLRDAGVPVAVMAAPMIPFVNDHELEGILCAAAGAGAQSAWYILLRLPLEIKDLFAEWLRAHIPERAERVLARIRDSHKGRLYQAEFGARMRGSGPYADLLGQRFRLACRNLGLVQGQIVDRNLDVSRFRPPRGRTEQLTLFD